MAITESSLFEKKVKTGKLVRADGKICEGKCRTILYDNLLEAAKDFRLGGKSPSSRGTMLNLKLEL